MSAIAIVSRRPDGQQSNGDSYAPSIAEGARQVAFTSRATNLVANDTNTCPDFTAPPGACLDIFVVDRDADSDGAYDEFSQAGAIRTLRVSVGPDGTQANDLSFDASLASFGGCVAYCSYASNLVPSDTNLQPDVFIHELATRQTRRISVSAQGLQANSLSCFPSIADNGRYVAFESNASNLIPGDTNNTSDIFVAYTGYTSRFTIVIEPTIYLPLIMK